MFISFAKVIQSLVPHRATGLSSRDLFQQRSVGGIALVRNRHIVDHGADREPERIASSRQHVLRAKRSEPEHGRPIRHAVRIERWNQGIDELSERLFGTRPQPLGHVQQSRRRILMAGIEIIKEQQKFSSGSLTMQFHLRDGIPLKR